MATGTANPNYHGQLTASTADTITVAANCQSVEVVNVDGTAAIYYTADGSAPTVGGANCRVLPASISVDDPAPARFDGNIVISLISTGTPHYAVMGSTVS